MKKSFSLTLSLILVLQNLIYAQTAPKGKEVEEIYAKIFQRVNSSFVNQIAEDNDTTPLMILSAASAGLVISSRKEFAALLKQLNIHVSPTASIIELSDATFQEFKNLRISNDALIDYIGNVYDESVNKLSAVYIEDPRITDIYEEYIGAKRHARIIKELNKLDLPGYLINKNTTNLKTAKANFYQICEKVGITPKEFTIAYNNVSQLTVRINELSQQYNLLDDFTVEMFAYRGEYEALQDIKNLRNMEGADLSTLAAIYTDNAVKAEQALYEMLDKVPTDEELFANPDILFHKEADKIRYQAEDLNLAYTEQVSKLETLERVYNGESVTKFTKKGGLFIGIFALFSLTEKVIKGINIRKYVSSRNQAEMALQDILSDNSNDLFPILELLPENAKKSAFTYIAENHYENFTEQSVNILFALSVLENPQEDFLTSYNTENDVNLEFGQYFDKNYKILIEQISSNYI